MAEINGTLGNDTLIGTDGDDVINGSGGQDVVDSGAGYDELNFNVWDTSLFSAAAGSRTYTITSGGIFDSSGGINTSFTDIETIRLETRWTGDYGDTIDASGWTSNDPNVSLGLSLGNGNDTVVGSNASDVVDTGLGINTVDTGGGWDFVFAEFDNSAGVPVYVTGSGGQVIFTQNGVQIDSIVNAESVITWGEDFNAALTIVDASGLTGYDGLLIEDNNGTNISIGSPGHDIFRAEPGATVGNDVLTGGGGADVYDYTNSITAMNGDTITDFNGDDTLDLRSINNSSGLLATTFIGGAQFSGAAGEYRYEVIDGNTELQVDTDGDGIADQVLTLSDAAVALGEIAPNVLMSFGISGTQGDDVFNGTDGNDAYYAQGGNDTINGFGGNDTIVASAGDDQLSGGLGDDYLDGGDGQDIADYGAAAGSVVVDLASGTATGADGNDTLVNIEWIQGSAYDDTLTGNGDYNYISGGGGDDVIHGAGGDDGLFGGDGNDQVYGDDGNDQLVGGAGDDLLDGGDGEDIADYGGAAGSVVVDLGAGTATGADGNDTLVSIEWIQGSAYDDQLTGDGNYNFINGGGGNDTLDGAGGDDTLFGGDGNDALHGGDGNDQLVGQAGDDLLDGGDGRDVADYQYAAGSVTVDLSSGSASGADGNDTLIAIEDVNGSAYDDQLTGDAGDNYVNGSDGNDVIGGSGGNDYLVGGNGNDTIEGGAGADSLDGGNGNDTASYANALGGVSVNLGFGFASGADGNDSLVNFENLIGSNFDDTLNGNGLANVLTGGDGNDSLSGAGGGDTLDGGSGNDALSGGGGNDALYAGTGNDFLNGGFGNDTIDGGDGFDRVGYFGGATTGVTVDLRLQGVAQNVGEQGFDTLTNIEGVSGTIFADTLTGDGNDNWLWGSVSGGGTANNDTIDGQGGNDLLSVGIGNLSLTGGSGVDTVSFGENGGAEPNLTISLALQGGAQSTGAGNWTLNGVENLSGGLGNDALTGDGGANVLAGYTGSDTLVGGAGNDTLYGDGFIGVDSRPTGGSGPITTFTDATLWDPTAIDGTDTLEGGLGDDQLWGGGGIDTAQYVNAAGSVTVTLFNNTSGNGTASGGDGNDTLVSIENITGSAFGDTLTGSAAANVLVGGDGNDFLQARGGDDTVYGGDGNDYLGGGTGNDYLDGGDGWDRASFSNGSTGPVQVDLRITGAQDTGLGIDTLVNIENVNATSFSDTLIGNDVANWLWGGTDDINFGDTIDGQGGDDLIEDGVGNHVLTGGSGIDTFLFNPFTAATNATISLALQGAAQDTGAGIMTLTGFENLSGSSFDDTLIGNSDNNLLAGSEGNDSLVGGGGNDTLYGDGLVATSGSPSGPITTYDDVAQLNGVDGNDTLEGGLGDDQLWGGGGIDTASYANASGAVQVSLFNGGGSASGADGNDTLNSIENVTGSAFNDALSGDSGANVLTGGGGNDALVGGGGNDTLLGGSGNDLFNGGFGNDTIDGGTGFDRAGYFNGATTGVTVDLRLQGVAQNVGELGLETLTNIEAVSGTIYADTLTGDGNDNWLWGSIGGNGGTNNDTLDGQGGNDLLSVGIGNQRLTGGSGIDTVAFTENGGVEPNLNISLALQGTAQATGAGNWTLNGVENLSGGLGGDTLTGDSGANVLAGYTGSDTLVGGAGNDTLYGDGLIWADTRPTGGSGPITTFTDATQWDPAAVDGNDTLEGGLGNDTINGGGGIDTASYANASGAVTVTLTAGGGSSSGADGSDTLFSIENVTGSAFNDTITGNSGNNILSGGAGIDTLTGGGGDDTLVGGLGADILDGGTGIDTADYSGSTAAVSVNLQNGKGSGGAANGDTLSNIENTIGSGFNDTLVGNSAANVLNGGAGNDTLNGGGGADTLYGGLGSDIFVFKSSAEIGTGVSHDLLMDFDAGGNGSGTRVDFIDLTGIDAIARTTTRDDAFSFIGTNAFTNRAGELRIEITGNGTANVLGDTNGDGVADFVLELHYTGTLDASDFGP